MIRMIQSSNAGHAKSYFNDALSKGDYYLDDQELGGLFHGKVAEQLGIDGKIDKDQFYKLCDNINPVSGEKLTARIKSNRTVGYDINFHAPKSLSILHALGTDKRVLKAFQDSVRFTMQEIEKDIKTRVRAGGKVDERVTGNMIWGEFIHQTARPVDGMAPDPHLHCHCYVQNLTFDREENKFKAAQFRDIKRDMPLYQSLFHKKLAQNLDAIGYETRATEKSFEVEMIPQAAIDVFSKRTDAIGRYAKEKGITDPKALDKIGAVTRAKKEKGWSMSELKDHWLDQVRHIKGEGDRSGALAEKLTQKNIKNTLESDVPKHSLEEAEKENNAAVVKDEKKHLESSASGTSKSQENPISEETKNEKIDNFESPSPKQCIDHALEHCFERHSVMQDRKILSAAISYGIRNKAISIEDIKEAFEKDKRILKIENKGYVQCTTIEVHGEEKEMVALARKGKGAFTPLAHDAHQRSFHGLNNQQTKAVRHALNNNDQLLIIRGGAGTGKTTLMNEAIKNIEGTGYQVYTFAPTSEARNVLHQEGQKEAQTVARLLVDKGLQKNLKGQVLWVDEAGLLSTKDMRQLLSIADKQKARVILSGDTRQHSSVARGDALRILRNVGGVKIAGVHQIYRQKEENYKQAVSYISQGKVEKAFQKLDSMQAIQEKHQGEVADVLAKDYLDCIDKNKSALVIAPTHAQGDKVTQSIRDGLKEREVLTGKERGVTRLKNKNLTLAEKKEAHHYAIGDVVQFSQNGSGIKRGQKLTVAEIIEKKIVLNTPQGTKAFLPTDKPQHFDVYKPVDMELCKGEQIRITRNAQLNSKLRLDNGTFLKVTGFNRQGDIKVKRGETGKEIILPKDFGHLNHAYCLTSHAAQGKTVDQVFIAQPASTFPATNMKQFYVSVSRGRENVTIYTDSKEEMLDHIHISGDRLSAMELKSKSEEVIRLKGMEQQKEHEKNINKNIKEKRHDHGNGIEI